MNTLLTRVCCFVFTSALLLLAAGCSREAKAQRYVARGDKDFAAGKYQRAEIEYMSAVRLGSTNASAVAGLGFVYFQQGRIPQAYGAFARTLELDPSNTAARLKLGLLCRALGQTATAREHAIQVLDKLPGSDEALLLLVESSTGEAELNDCLRRIEALPQESKGGLADHLARGAIKFRHDDLDGAEAEFKQAMARDPKSERPYLSMAGVHLARKQPAEAEAAAKTAAELASLRSPARIYYANLLLTSGKVEEAKEVAAEITEKAPDYLTAWTFLANTAFKQGDLEECSKLVKKILELDPTNYEGLTLNGKLLLSKNDAPAAIKQFEWIVEAYGTNAEHFYNLATAQVQNRQENQAVVTLDRAISSRSNYVDAIVMQSGILLRQGVFDRVASSLRNIISQAERMPSADRAKLPYAFALLGRAQIGQRNFAEAAQTYQAMRKVFPGLVDVQLEAANGLSSISRTNDAIAAYKEYVDRSTNSVGLLLAGSGLARLNDNQSARSTFEKIRKISPTYLPAVEALIQLDIRDQNFDGAFARAKQEIEKPNAGGLPWVLLANVHLEKAALTARKEGGPSSAAGFIKFPASQSDVKAAETALLKSIEIDPNLMGAYHQLAKIWVAQDRHEEALTKLTFLTSKTNDLMAQVQIALIQTEKGDYKAAADAYEKALTFAPDSIEVLNNLAALYSIRIPSLDRARELAEKVRRLAPAHPAVADTLGWIFFMQGQYPQALALLEEAARRIPDSAELQYHLGMTYYMLGQEEPARSALQRAAASSTDFAGKAEAPACLAVLAIDPAKADQPAVATLEKRIKESPGDVAALGRLATIYERNRAYDRAAETYQAILNNSQSNPFAAFNLARLYADHLNQPEKALDLAKAARNGAPNDPRVAHLLGRLSWAKGNWAYAATLLEDSARKLPDDPAIAHDLAWAYYSLGRVADAEAAMKTAVAAQNFANAEDCKRFLKFVGAANSPATAAQIQSEADQVLKSDQNYVPALYVSAVACDAKKEFDQAAKLYERVLSTYPLFTPAMRNLAILSFEHLKQDEKAYDLALKARQAFPLDPLLARTLGILSFRRGENARAAQILRDASESRTNDAEVLFYLGMSQRALKSKADARQSLERALALSIPDPLAAEAKTALAELK